MDSILCRYGTSYVDIWGEATAPQIRRVLADNIVCFINLFTYLLT